MAAKRSSSARPAAEATQFDITIDRKTYAGTWVPEGGRSQQGIRRRGLRLVGDAQQRRAPRYSVENFAGGQGAKALV